MCFNSDFLGDPYPVILGKAWERLPQSVRKAHGIGTELKGYFHITHGKSRFVQTMVRWMRLPREGSSIPTVLRIRQDGNLQHWERHFGNDCLFTKQGRVKDLLWERFDAWELRFHLSVEGDALLFRQVGASLCLGKFRLPMPWFLSPQVRAKEEAQGPNGVEVQVFVSLPFVGTLISYEGCLNTEAITTP